MSAQAPTILTESANTKETPILKDATGLVSIAELMNRFCNAETKPTGTIGSDHHLADLDLQSNRAQMVFFIPSKSYNGVNIEVRIWFEGERISPLSAYTYNGENTEELLTTEDKMQVLHAYFCNVHQLIKFI